MKEKRKRKGKDFEKLKSSGVFFFGAVIHQCTASEMSKAQARSPCF